MFRKDRGFTLLEVVVVVVVIGIVVIMALPSARNVVNNYRLHGDASAVASYLNVARMRSASQYAPYRVNFDIGARRYAMEKLCGDTPASVDSACTSPYQAFTVRQIEMGIQYAGTQNTFSSCRPSGIGVFPGTITAGPTGCPGSGPDPLQIYFNTRGLPVDSTGNPLGSGGTVLYVANQNRLVDAITVSVGGRVTVWNWEPSAGGWAMR